MVFQDFGLLEDRSVDANLDFALVATGWKDKKAKARRIEEVLTAVDCPTRYKLPFEPVEENNNVCPLRARC